MYVKKKRPGGTSHGYQWPKPGVWVEMPDEHAAELVAIQPDEFEAQPDLPRGAKVHKQSEQEPDPEDPNPTPVTSPEADGKKVEE